MEKEINPYEPPTSILEDPDNLLDPTALVSGWRRFSNSIVDGICLWVISTITNFLLIMIVKSPESPMIGCGFMILNLLMNYLYFVCFEFFLGKTPGKYLTRTIVVNETGGKPSLPQILGRSAARFIPFDCFSFFGKQSRGWHDLLSGTLVVSTKST